MLVKETDQDTEKLIMETAKNIFFGEGRFNATTQEIADAAGVNRTLINYYFRSRDKPYLKMRRKRSRNLQSKLFSLTFR